MPFHFRIQVLCMLQGLWFSSVWQGGDERESSAGDWVLCYLMLQTAVNNLREQICIHYLRLVQD